MNMSAINPLNSTKTENDNLIVDKYNKWNTNLHEQNQALVYKTIYDIVKDGGPEDRYLRLYIGHILTYGIEKLRNDLSASWQNQGAVAGFVGAISISILLNPLAKSEGFTSSVDLTNAARSYYAIWSLAAFAEISSLLLLLILSLHINFAVTEIDFLNFIIEWIEPLKLPETLTAIGCYAMFIATCVGSFVIADTLTGVIVTLVSGILSLIVTVIWIRMIKVNVQKGIDTSTQIINSFIESNNNLDR